LALVPHERYQVSIATDFGEPIVYLIPSPKQSRHSAQNCQLENGLSLTGTSPQLEKLLGTIGIHVSPKGVPLHIIDKSVEVPKNHVHKELIEQQSYKLEITPEHIDITASSKEGIYSAIATLRQLLIQYPLDEVPCVEIVDYPEIPYRGIMVDVSRGKIPNRTTFIKLVELCFTYKYNIIQLYWEDCYRLPDHPTLGVLNGYYDRDEVAWMENLCTTYGIELQANIQTFSHVHGIVRIPGYEHLAENTALFTFAPGNEGVYDFLDEIFGEVLGWFSSKTVHLNMDEAYDLGTGYSRNAVEESGKEAVYVQHINRVAALARKHGARKLLVWGDALTKYPKLPEKVGDDIVFVDWNYNPETHYPSLELYDGRNREFWIAPGTSSWNAIFPRLQNSFVNIQNYISEGMVRNTSGVLLTHWGDYGHHQPFSFSNIGFIYGAEQAYNAGKTDLNSFWEAFSKIVLKDKRVEETVRILSHTNELPSVQVGFKSQSLYSLFDDFFKGLTLVGDGKYPAIPQETFQGFIEMGKQATGILTLLVEEPHDDNCIHLQELLLAAEMFTLAGKKGMLGLEIRAAFAAGRVAERNILQWIFDIKLLFAEFSRIRSKFCTLWEQEAVTVGREGALYIFDKAATRYDEAVRYLAGQRLALAEGKEIERNMKSYNAHEGYTILWTMDCLNLWDRAYPWR